MVATDLSYFLIAAGFVCVVNLIAFTGLYQNYSNTRKAYIALACLAIVVEMSRQIPDTFLAVYPESNDFYLISFALQFLASLIFLYALQRRNGELQRQGRVLLGCLVVAYLGSAAFQLVTGLPQTLLAWYLVSAPAIVVSLAICRTVAAGAPGPESGRKLLLFSSIALFLVRLWLPAISSLDLLYLVYYMEVLIFPLMLIALNLSEIESAYKRVTSLLQERVQSEQNLQFILDNSLDIILIANQVGLLRSWNKRAEALFGYSETQTVGKIHIDELFSDNYWHKDAEQISEFEATMEDVDGGSFQVTVRLKTVHRDDENYSIYVINAPTTLRLLAGKSS